jgi:hypothetical protein
LDKLGKSVGAILRSNTNRALEKTTNEFYPTGGAVQSRELHRPGDRAPPVPPRLAYLRKRPMREPPTVPGDQRGTLSDEF